MTDPAAWPIWSFYFIITGDAEEVAIPKLVGKAVQGLHGTYRHAGTKRINQRPTQRIIGLKTQRAQAIPEHVEVAIAAGNWVSRPNSWVLWIDDLERCGRDDPQAHYDHTRGLINEHIPEKDLQDRCGVHFLVNMLEAYFLADVDACNPVLGTTISNHPVDCENVKNPAGKLDEAIRSIDHRQAYKKVEHGKNIVNRLNLDTVLSDSRSCRALRTLVAWCWESISEPRTERFQLIGGVYWEITAPQLQLQPSQQQIGPLNFEEENFTPQVR